MAKEILLYDYEDEYGWPMVIGMGDNSGASISAQIEEASGEDITLRISSTGGYCFAAIQIITAIKKHGNVTAQIDGVCFSSAAVIAASCKSVTGYTTVMLMIHNCRMDYDVYGSFTSDDLKELVKQSANQMDAFDRLQSNLFAQKTGLSTDQINVMLSQETWLSGQEAKDLGFIDTLIDGEIQAISRKLYDTAFAKAPMRMVAMAGKNLKIKENNNDMSANAELLNQVKAQHEETKSFWGSIATALGVKPKVEEEPELTEVEKLKAELEAAKIKLAEKEALKTELEATKSELASEKEKNTAKEAELQTQLTEVAAIMKDTKSFVASAKEELKNTRSGYVPDGEKKEFGSQSSEPEAKFVKPSKKK